MRYPDAIFCFFHVFIFYSFTWYFGREILLPSGSERRRVGFDKQTAKNA